MKSNTHTRIAQDTKESNQKVVKPFLLITGMHRSGTSFLARALNLHGVYLGDLEELTSHEWRPLPDNLRGHWEHKKILELTEKTLAYNKGSWDNPPQDMKINEEIGQEITQCIQELINHDSLAAGFKDPRIILCLDTWREYLPKDILFVGIFRHPLKVAESLKRRNQFSYEKSLRLWTLYNEKMLDHLKKYGGFLLNFDWPKERLLSEISYITNQVGLVGDIDLNTWYSKELFRSDTTYDSTYVLPETVLDIYEKLKKRSEENAMVNVTSFDVVSQESMDIIGSLLTEMQRQGIYFKQLNDNNRSMISMLEESIHTKELQRRQLQELSEKYYEQLESLQRELHKKISELENIRSSITFKALQRIARFIDTLAPLGTRRAEIARLTLSAVTIAQTQGSRSLLRTILAKLSSSALTASIKNISKQPKQSLSLAVDNYRLPENITCIPHSSTPRDDQTLRDFIKPDSANIFNLSSSPLVSIIIPTFDNIQHLKKCLESLEKTAYRNHEIIIITNNKDENSLSRLYLSTIRHKVIIYPEEFAFGAVNNHAAKAASGEFLLFLNDDTEIVDPYWLHALLKLGLNRNVGAVGAKLIYPNRSLQEAGCVVWKDGTAWNCGRNASPVDPAYNYVREVDYCSGSCLFVNRAVWDSLGGFDETYRPSYGEDVDLCFRIRELGYSVLYQPLAPIIHEEGGTMGRDIKNGYKSYQPINQKRLYEKWKHVLDNHSLPTEENALFERNRKPGLNILFIDHYVPSYDQDSGSLRTYSMISILSGSGHKVTFWPDNLAQIEPYTKELQQKGIEVIYSALDFKTFVQKRRNYFHLAILSRADVAVKYIDIIRKHAPHCKIIYDTVDLHFLRLFGQAHIEHDAKVRDLAKRMHDIELTVSRKSDLVLVCTLEEAQILLTRDPSIRTSVFPNIHLDQKEIPLFNGRQDLIFVGGFRHRPNVDAALFLAKEIFPVIKKKLPEVKLYIVGSNPPQEITDLNSDDIIVTGQVPDITYYLNKCRVMVAPIRYGSGIKGKITQSMSLGLPVVTNTVGAKGTGLSNRDSAIIADRIEDFANGTIDLYMDESLWNKFSSNALKIAREKYSPEAIRKLLVDILNEVLGLRMRSRSPLVVTQISNYATARKKLSIEQIMQRDWDTRALENAKYFIRSDLPDQTDEEFFESGKQSVNELIVPFLDTICVGKDPKDLRALEIGCGIGRMTRRMVEIFGEVHAVDVSGEMIKIGKEKLKDLRNVYLYRNNGKDLSMFGNNFFDFCFSFIVFQHIPDKEVIASYIKEASRVLKRGGIFLLQVHGTQDPNYVKMQKNTWMGVSFYPEEMREIAKQNNFWIVKESGQRTQYYWLTLVKK